MGTYFAYYRGPTDFEPEIERMLKADFSLASGNMTVNIPRQTFLFELSNIENHRLDIYGMDLTYTNGLWDGCNEAWVREVSETLGIKSKRSVRELVLDMCQLLEFYDFVLSCDDAKGEVIVCHL